MQEGLVTVNGQVVREMGTRVSPERDEVRVRGRVVRLTDVLLYLLMNKPAGVVTTASDPEGRPTVLDQLPAAWRTARVYPIGRLDYDTEGLLLLTNDGELAHRLMHPSFEMPKEYQALVEGTPSPETLARLARGVRMEGDPVPTAPARVWLMREIPNAGSWVGVELHEGRNRQVRRMLDAVGHHALRLRRVRLGPLTLGKLRQGDTRELTADELAALRAAVGLGGDDVAAAETPASAESVVGAQPTADEFARFDEVNEQYIADDVEDDIADDVEGDIEDDDEDDIADDDEGVDDLADDDVTEMFAADEVVEVGEPLEADSADDDEIDDEPGGVDTGEVGGDLHLSSTLPDVTDTAVGEPGEPLPPLLDATDTGEPTPAHTVDVSSVAAEREAARPDTPDAE